MGIRTEIYRFPSTAIGAGEVIPIQMAEAYASFATLGIRVRPQPILRVLSPAGDTLWEPQPERTPVLDSLTARVMVSMLEDVVARGTGANARTLGELPYEVPAAGKTGTTNDGTNVWFMGFTPNLMAGVWFGMDRPVTIWPKATGGQDAAPVWGAFMRRVYYGDSTRAYADSVFQARGYRDGEGTSAGGPTGAQLPGEVAAPVLRGGFLLPIPEPWPMLPGLVTRLVDSRTGLLASRWCPAEQAYWEVYLPGTEPTEPCDMSLIRR
jgi:membrane peptidoglycan carboxypeptidase